MALSLKVIRLRSVWLLVPVFLMLARPSTALLVPGAVLTLLGGLLRAWAAGTIQKNKILTTSGPYAYCRNPLYLGTFLVGLGVTVASGSPYLVAIFVLFFAIIYGGAMKSEERRLESLFGEPFRDYAAAVPLFLPRLRPYRGIEPATTQFLLRQYFAQREWQLALGVVLAFLALVAKMIWF
jgi:protein-S-isoprenylcysteine O-methyltransferase Ste14